MTFTIDEFADLKNCPNYQVKRAYYKKELDGQYLKFGKILMLVIEMNEKSELWQSKPKANKTFYVKGKKHLGEAYHYRNDLMGQFCSVSLNTELQFPIKGTL